ncbi:alcohol dehydrogenase IV [Desarmillaria tabescens]|uniref:Alcohol dehydrogenase IV n=1 Tax=Armillaria tabescens TaxID=1929756 RepID=A0AA39KCG6_ARMTA|nr:alcohol dehydrogenase IV [Desarmillaria tabescens]KAK0458616.1 alcohol dehydrogenase IV [Desarmillaria tabescens]
MTTSSSLQGFYGWPEGLTGVYYGPGSVSTALPKLLSTLGARKALIVTTRSLVGKTELVKQVESILKDHDAFGATFHEIGEHSPIAGIRRAVKVFRENDCNIIVSIGGGSPIDASKAVLYFSQEETGGPILPQIAIPTTLSAAEYTIGAGYTNDQGQKAVVSSRRLVPAGIILDAEFTLPTPERLWLSTGIRALDHAVENLYRRGVAFPVKVLCYSAIADLFKYLPASKANPQDVEVRQRLQLASWMSIWPMNLERYGPLGLSHALGHKLGAAYGIPHGITSCLTLAPVVAMKAQTESQENKETLTKVLPHLHLESTGSVDKDVLLVSKSIKDLVASLGLASDLATYKVPREDAGKIAELALGSKEDPVYGKVIGVLESLYPAGEV